MRQILAQAPNVDDNPDAIAHPNAPIVPLPVFSRDSSPPQDTSSAQSSTDPPLVPSVSVSKSRSKHLVVDGVVQPGVRSTNWNMRRALLDSPFLAMWKANVVGLGAEMLPKDIVPVFLKASRTCPA